MSFKKRSRDMPPTSRDVDNLTYNPQAEVGVDSAAFDPDADNNAVGARGGYQPTARNFEREDMETERSDQTGKIPRGEVDDLLSDITEDEKNISGSGRTRGVQNDAWKQDKELDQSFRDSGLAEAEQDVEIGRAVGN